MNNQSQHSRRPDFRTPRLGSRDVHVWMFESGCQPVNGRDLLILPRDERSRSRTIESEEQKRHFLWGRIMTRYVVSLYTNRRPQDLQFRRNRDGKPQLRSRPHPLRFNVTHTGTLVLVAISRSGLLGIDAEVLRDSADLNEVAADFFSTKELGVLHSSEGGARVKVFFRLWTGKEAFVKATGRGISNVRLKRIDLSRAVSKRSHFQSNPARYVRWFTPLSGAVAAIACNMRPRSVRFFHWRKPSRA